MDIETAKTRKTNMIVVLSLMLVFCQTCFGIMGATETWRKLQAKESSVIIEEAVFEDTSNEVVTPVIEQVPSTVEEVVAESHNVITADDIVDVADNEGYDYSTDNTASFGTDYVEGYSEYKTTATFTLTANKADLCSDDVLNEMMLNVPMDESFDSTVTDRLMLCLKNFMSATKNNISGDIGNIEYYYYGDGDNNELAIYLSVFDVDGNILWKGTGYLGVPFLG